MPREDKVCSHDLDGVVIETSNLSFGYDESRCQKRLTGAIDLGQVLKMCKTQVGVKHVMKKSPNSNVL